MGANLISVKDIVKKYSLTYQAINHYTNFGLLEVATKNGNMRMYDAQHVDKRLGQIVHLKNSGYPLRLIRKMILEERMP
ncbi:MAG: MerR family transcriptional regulator [Candidatus Omnitrophota bacterium]